MAATLSYYVNDASTFANFTTWAAAIGNSLLGSTYWAQTTDTGQIQFTGCTLTSCTLGSSPVPNSATFAYSGATGPAFMIGRAVNISGYTSSSAANNGTYIITAVVPGTSFTVTNAAAVAGAGTGSPVVTITVAVGSGMGSGTYYYEIYTPTDGLTTFYVKLLYGNNGAANAPAVQVQLSTLTNGAGICTGFTTSQFACVTGTATATSATIPYECRFSAGSSYFCFMLWRGLNTGQLVSVERSVGSGGSYAAGSGNSNHVTVVAIGSQTTGNTVTGCQQTLTLGGNGAAPIYCTQNTNAGQIYEGLSIRIPNYRISTAFNGNVTFDTYAPCIGFYDYPLYNLAGMSYLNIAEGQTITVSVYGNNHTYVSSQAFPFSQSFPGSGSYGNALCMRYE